MIQQSSSVSSDAKTYSDMTQARTIFVPKTPLNPFPFHKIDTTDAELTISSPNSVHLDFENLGCFEAVEKQFLQVGVVFHNAIALKPSNPSFPVEFGQTVLMGAPRSGLLDATFVRPVKFVHALLTSSRRAIITAFDETDAIVAKAEIPTANLANSNASCSPNQPICLKASAIHRIRIRSIGGQFTMGNVAFGY